MVDEYQDTNTVQEQILLLLSGERKNLCVVGDDDQGLYRFRDATIRNILEFPSLFPLGDEFRSVVGADMSWHATQGEQIRKHVDDIMRIQSPRHPDRQRLPGEFVDDIQHAQLAAVMRTILDEIVGPDMVWPLRLQPDARAVIQPQAP
jgi:UvrD/REP helicase N-terminal domain